MLSREWVKLQSNNFKEGRVWGKERNVHMPWLTHCPPTVWRAEGVYIARINNSVLMSVDGWRQHWRRATNFISGMITYGALMGVIKRQDNHQSLPHNPTHHPHPGTKYPFQISKNSPIPNPILPAPSTLQASPENGFTFQISGNMPNRSWSVEYQKPYAKYR